MCLIVLSCTQVSEKGKLELEQAITALRQLENWEINRLALMEDHRETF